MILTFKNEPLELISGAALHLPTKFGEDQPKDLGEVGEQTEEKKKTNLTFDLDDLDLSKNEPLKPISGAALHLPSKFRKDRPKDLGGVGEQTNKQTDKRCSNYSMMIWARRPSWSCNLDFRIKLSLPLPRDAPYKISV